MNDPARLAPGFRLGSVSAVFPAFNDGGTIASMVLAARVALRQVVEDYEIIVVNDGSRDYTVKVLDELSNHLPELVIIHHPVNYGYGAALRSGFAAAAKEWIFYTDGDAQYDPAELVHLVAALQPGVEVVNGYKLSRTDPPLRVFLGWAYNHLVRLLFRVRLRDVDCDFRLFHRGLLDHVRLESSTGTICLEMVRKFQDAGALFVEVPVHHYARPYGSSQFFSPPHLLRTAQHLVVLWKDMVWRRRHEKVDVDRLH